MQIGLRAPDVDLQVRQTTKRRTDGGHVLADHGGVADDHVVARQPVPVGRHERHEVLAADLLLPLGQDHHVHRQRAVDLHVGLDRLHVEVELALVVHRAPGEELAVTHLRLEGRRRPLVQRLRGLDIVVAVDQHRGRIRPRPSILTQHDGEAVRGLQRHLEARAPHLVGQPLGRGPHVVPVLRLGADGRDPEELVQLLLEAGHVVLDVFVHVRHICPHRVSGFAGHRPAGSG